MYVVSLTYKVPEDIVEFHLPAHLTWLQAAFDDGVFMVAGRKIPRTGEFEVMEFHANRVAPGYENLLDS